MREHADAPAEILRKVRAICLALPQVYEETAWVGTRWRSRSKTIAHVVPVEENWPPAYVRATESVATGAPLVVMTFRAHEAEHAAFRAVGYPYFVPVWWPDIVWRCARFQY